MHILQVPTELVYKMMLELALCTLAAFMRCSKELDRIVRESGAVACHGHKREVVPVARHNLDVRSDYIGSIEAVLLCKTLRALAKGGYISNEGTEVTLPTRWMKDQAR